MNAAGLRRFLIDEELQKLLEAGSPSATMAILREMVDRLADREGLFEADLEQRERASLLAASLLDEEAESREFDAARLRHARGDWLERAAAARHLFRGGIWIPRLLFGSPVPVRTGARTPRAWPGLDIAVARALLIGLREALIPETASARTALRGSAAAPVLRLKNPKGERFWEAANSPILRHAVGNALALGDSRQSAALKVLAGSLVIKGELLLQNEAHGETAIMLGSAAAVLLQKKPLQKTKAQSALAALASRLAVANQARSSLWDDIDAEIARRLGAAASVSAFERGRSAPSPVPASSRARFFVRLPAGWRDRFSYMTAEEAASALERICIDPRSAEEDARMAEALAETLRAHPGRDRVSFAEALGIEPAERRFGTLEPGQEVFRAVIGGAPGIFACVGTRGRRLRCRPVANADGAFVGYAAFDALSRELGSRPLHALYDLQGDRYGYAWDESLLVVQRGQPSQGFVTAPERIPLISPRN